MRAFASKALALCAIFALLGCGKSSVASARAKQMKEWTFMVFLNGHNNLDSYGALNINQLETVGSTEDVDFVVQWASMDFEKTKRLHVEKDSNEDVVTSPILEEIPRVDMGDYRELVKFIQWTVEHYPSKRYFVSLWNHGSGWHRFGIDGTRDINFDDISGNAMTTEQMGIAMKEAARIMGHKVDILGSDACLMAMLEINDEFAPSVSVAVASEENIPGLGWPYDALARRWVANPKATPAEVTTILTEEYVKLYLPGGAGYGRGEVTLSSANLEAGPALNEAMKAFGEQIRGLDREGLDKIRAASEETQRFSSYDYADLGHFVKLVAERNVPGLGRDAVTAVQKALDAYVISNHTTPKYHRATGASFWLPTSAWTFEAHRARYEALRFDLASSWSKTLATLVAE